MLRYKLLIFGMVWYTEKITQFSDVSKYSGIGNPEGLSFHTNPKIWAESVRINFDRTLKNIKGLQQPGECLIRKK